MTGAIELTGVLGDVVYLAITVAFFAFAALVVRACERVVGEEETVAAASPTESPARRSAETEAFAR